MELELGLKFTKVSDDFTTANLLIAKDRAGPLFLSRETETMFILTAHLKGYRRENIKIDINEDGTEIAISGENLVQEMIMVGGRMVKREMEMREFRKAFKIPAGVILDKITANFKKDEWILVISMPKLVKGVRGVGIEEVNEEEEEDDENGEVGIEDIEGTDQTTKRLPEEHEKAERSRKKQATDQDQPKEDQLVRGKEVMGRENDIEEEGESLWTDEEHPRDRLTQTEKIPPKKSMLCAPILAGSALLISFVVLVIHLIRVKSQHSKKH